MILLLVVAAVLIVIGAFAVGIYNRLVQFRENARSSFAQIDVQLERRHDLIPNLVATASGYLKHERETLEAVIAARASATQLRVEVNGEPSNIEAMQKLATSETNLGGALGRLMATAEAYPDLKANQQMQTLTEELRTTENRISFARQNYNGQVRVYQNYKKSFPPILFASLFGFQDDAYLDLDTEDKADKREVVQVDFDQDAA